MVNKDSMQQSQPGTGSSENRGQERSEQRNQGKDIPRQDRQHIANQVGEDARKASTCAKPAH